MTRPPPTSKRLSPLVIGAIGVVFGDIGTSPLYTLRECFTGPHGLPLTPANVLGILSIIFWALMIVVTLKYVTLIMRADNRGEGGILALTALVSRGIERKATAALVARRLRHFRRRDVLRRRHDHAGDLGAVRGRRTRDHHARRCIRSSSRSRLVIVVVLFAIQKHGTARVGSFFGPVMCVWFVVLAVLGLKQIVREPGALAAINPVHAVAFVADNPMLAFLALGAVVLAVTGTEALYADMGHFGATPIRRAWLFFVLPALVLNYFGQGALIIHDPTAIKNPFYLLAPAWALLPMVVLATCATVIASQAVISGAFSLTRQAIQMGYCPRLTIMHTSEREIGQIYVPFINWTLLCAVMLLVAGFRSSGNLGGAYGIAVTLAMVIDSVLIFVVMRRLWHWSVWLRSRSPCR